MKITAKDYNKMAKQHSKNSPIFRNSLYAFFVGGGICTVGQGIQNLLKAFEMNKDGVSAGTAIIMIFIGAFLTGIGIYDKLAKYAGAGTLVPITGFANAIVSPAMEFKSEGIVLGLAVKMFAIAGPVLVFGIVASVVYGLVLYIFKLY
jgi:stage V sporulation protein AC